MPISAITISVSGSIRARVSGRPISLLCPPSAATTFACGAQSAARMSFVDVFPVEPVIPTTIALLREQTAAPIAASAPNSSAGWSTAAAPRANACLAKSPPPPTATNRSPSSTRLESTCIPVASSVQPAQVQTTERLHLRERKRDHALAPNERSASRHFAVVERQHATADLLALLVALAGDHDHVALPRRLECPLDRRPPVRARSRGDRERRPRQPR